MAKLTLTDGTIFEGTTKEIFAITERYNGAKSDEPAEEPAKELTHNGVEYKLVDREAQEGDIVVFTESDVSYVTNGKPYEVVEDGGDLEIIDNDDDSIYVYFEDSGRTESNTHVYEPKAEPLKYGDSVIVSGKSIFGVDLDGKLGSYEGASTYYAPSHAQVRVPNEKGYVVKYANIRKATEEEVAEAKAKAEATTEQARKEAVFTQVGRKPNEYREGDIVGYDSKKYGQVVIREVTAVDGDFVAYYSEGFGKDGVLKDSERLSLIATVESRLDRN